MNHFDFLYLIFLNITSYIDNRHEVYYKKIPPQNSTDIILNNAIKGIYDPAINTAYVFLSSHIIINEFNIKEEEIPTLLLSLERNEYYENLVYKSFNIQAQFNRMNNLIIPVENVYVYGKFNGISAQYYRLKANRKKEIMKIILSFNSNKLSCAIGDRGSLYNSTRYEINAEKKGGKIIITINIMIKNLICLYKIMFSNILIWKMKQNF